MRLLYTAKGGGMEGVGEGEWKGWGEGEWKWWGVWLYGQWL